ncbi:MAG: DPP IV N-terminal domain-containing protein [Candidatus Didemnitutus sp.]|nr:DPP IV N-terminal domain-containing protein [Candidatus Didemnitutus sp.]
MRSLLPHALAVALLATAVRAEDDPNLTYFRDLAETRNYTLGRPVSPKLTPDGEHVIFLRAQSRNPTLRLYEFTVADGQERELLSPEQILAGAEEKLTAEEKARRERQRQSLRGFTSFEMSRDGARLLVVLSGKLYVVDRSDLKFTALPGQNWVDPRFSPDGKSVAAAKDRELFVIDLATNRERQLTSGATEFVSHGISEFVAQEEMKRDEGYWWSPDSTTLLYQETDESAVETRYIANALHPEEKPTTFAYPKAGSANAKVRLGLMSAAGGTTTWVRWDSERYPYLARVSWTNPRAPLTILVQNREQTAQLLLTVDPQTGTTNELLKETDAAWLNLDYDSDVPLWVKDGSRFLWTTERRGAWQVELRDSSGMFVRELTPSSFTFRGLVGLDENAGQVFVKGSLDAREVHLWRFPLAGGPGTQLTRETGHHNAVIGASGTRLVHTYDRFNGTYGVQVVDANGQPLAVLRSVAEALPRRPTTELTQTKSAPQFDAAITRPRNYEAGKKYPVILSVYAGPTAKRVNAVVRDYLPDQWMADQGYIVVRLDGRGTPWKGRDWERVIKGNFIDVALNDQIAGLTALASQYPELDLARVGVTGWSFGGYFSAMATIRRPDFFRAGVAGAPVVTWENYDTHYTERYLGLPQAAPDAYHVSDVTTYAHELRRPLMLIHGLTDDNVYFQHTLQLADALFLAGKPYELLPMLGTHMVSDPVVKLRQQQRIMEFFNLNLKGAQ